MRIQTDAAHTGLADRSCRTPGRRHAAPSREPEELVGGRLVDAGVAAALLDVPKTWVLAQARAGRIPHVRLGRYVRFEPDELQTWWQARRRGPHPSGRRMG